MADGEEIKSAILAVLSEFRDEHGHGLSLSIGDAGRLKEKMFLALYQKRYLAGLDPPWPPN
jgi:hypothetical protein